MSKLLKLMMIGMAIIMLSACVSGNSREFSAIQKIANYAQNGGTPPSVQVYKDAGIIGVTEENVDDINAVIAALNYEDVDTEEEIQALVDQLNIDITNPIFTSPSTVSVMENQTAALTLIAVDTSTVIYGIHDGESDSFNLDPSTGVVRFKIAPDYEMMDTYRFVATATDIYGNKATQDVTIEILDVAEAQAPKKTGQTKSYDEEGNEVNDNSLKDDGYYRRGTENRYTRDDELQIVTDHITSLEWQDDGDVSTVKKQWLTDENYDLCIGEDTDQPDLTKCYDTSGDTAESYCTNLVLGGYGDWRLPTADELINITDKGKENSAIDDTYFYNIHNASYWTSSNSVYLDKSAFAVSFLYGEDWVIVKDATCYMRCVRHK